MSSNSYEVVTPVRSRPLSALQTPENLAPLEMILRFCAAVRQVTMLVGREKSGKTTFAAVAACAVAAAMEFLGHSAPGRVLWVGLEESVCGMVQRFNAIGTANSNLFVLNRLSPSPRTRFEELAAEVAAVRPKLVVIDTLASFAEGILDENSPGQWVMLLNQLHRLAEDNGAAILFLHHATKATGSYRGSTAIGGAVDHIIEMHESDSDPAVRTMKCRGRWGVSDFRVRYDADAVTFHLVEDAVCDPPVGAEERILDALSSQSGMTRLDACKAAGGRAVVTRAAFDALHERGVIVQTPGMRGYQVAESEA